MRNTALMDYDRLKQEQWEHSTENSAGMFGWERKETKWLLVRERSSHLARTKFSRGKHRGISKKLGCYYFPSGPHNYLYIQE